MKCSEVEFQYKMYKLLLQVKRCEGKKNSQIRSWLLIHVLHETWVQERRQNSEGLYVYELTWRHIVLSLVLAHPRMVSLHLSGPPSHRGVIRCLDICDTDGQGWIRLAKEISGEGKMCVSLSAAILNTLQCLISYCIAYIAFISFCVHAIMATNQKASCCCISDSFKWHILCGSNIHAIQKRPFCCNGILVFAK